MNQTQDPQNALTKYRQKLEAMTLPKIADQINGLKGFNRRLSPDATEGDITGLKEIRNLIKIASKVFATKAGVDANDFPVMQDRIQKELAIYKTTH